VTNTATDIGLRELREATVRSHYEAENRHDVEAMLATFSPSRASYDVPAFGEAGQPADAASVRAMWEDILAVFPDIHHEVVRLRHGDDCVLVEYRVSGTHQAEWLGIPATGRPVQHTGGRHLRVRGRPARVRAGLHRPR